MKFSKLVSIAFLFNLFVFSSFPSANAAEEKAPVEYSTPQELIEAASKVDVKFEKDVNYTIVEGASLSEKKEVREYFSFFCGHCHQFLPIITKMSLALPEDAYFVGNPVPFLGGQMGPKTMKAYATAVSLQITEPFVELMNKKIFDLNQIPNSDEDLAAVFEELGIPKHKFFAQYNSFPINNMANQYKQKSEDSKISGVPSVIINNKYLIKPASVKGEAEYFALVTYLLNLDNDFYNKLNK